MTSCEGLKIRLMDLPYTLSLLNRFVGAAILGTSY